MSRSAAIVTTDRIERALRDAAIIVASPGGERYVAIFERLERELAQRQTEQDAIARARSLAQRVVAA